MAKLKDTFDKASICAIVKIPLSMRNKPDKLMWVANNHENFTVRSAYFLQQGVMTSTERSMWKKLWNLKIHERYKMLLWRIALNILPTRQRLQELGQVLDAKCPLCNCEEESSIHLFKECVVVKALWFGGRWNVRIDHWPSMSIFQLVQFVVDPPLNFLSTELTEAQFQTMVVVTWEQIWSIRNKVIFQMAKVKIDVLLAVIEKKF